VRPDIYKQGCEIDDATHPYADFDWVRAFELMPDEDKTKAHKLKGQ